MDRIITRKATTEDVPVMARLLDQLYAIEPEFTPNYERQKLGLEQCLQHPSLCQLLVAETQGEVIGFVNLQYSISSAYAGFSVHIDDFIVAEGLRGQGVGSTLMQAAIHAADQTDAIRITVSIDQTNKPGLRFYHKWGFESLNLLRHHRPLRP